MVDRYQQMVSIDATEQTQIYQRSFGQVYVVLNFSCFRLNRRAQNGFICQIPKVQHVQMIQLAFLYSAVPRLKALLGLPEHHPQCIVVLRQLDKRLTQSSFVKALLPVQHNRLIKMMRIHLLLFKEPVLDRKQRCFPAHFSLICYMTCLVHVRCQCCNGWISKQILHVQLVACLERTRYDLNRLNRIAAQIKEIVQHSDGWHAQD
ncbi:hypothetical protein D3C74_145070 [compost metagenome]